MIVKKLLTAQIISLGIFGFGTQNTAQPPHNLAKWDLICYCTARFFTPDPIVEMGNNGEILYEARTGITRANLKRKGIHFTERQLKILDACGLLEINGQILRTSIPVLGPEELQKIRQKLKQEAYKLGPIITPEIQNLVKLLNSQGYSDNTYSIIFSYLLDGMVWNHFEKQNLMPVYKITPERPFWDGTFYAVYPARIDRPGTNTNSSGSWTIAMTWTDPILKISSTSGFSNTLKLLLAEIKNKESITNSAFSKELLGHGLLSENGKLSVPIIHEQPGDPIFETTSEISQMIANVMIKTSQTPDFKKIIRTTDKAKALVIGYHEFMWEILSYLENENVLKSPFASNGNEQIKASDLHKLVYIIEKTQ